MERTEAVVVSMFLKTGGCGAGGGGCATGGGDTGPGPGWRLELGVRLSVDHLVHAGIVDADTINNIKKILGVHC